MSFNNSVLSCHFTGLDRQILTAEGCYPAEMVIKCPHALPLIERVFYNYLSRTLHWIQPACDFRLNIRDLFDRQTLSLRSPHEIFQNLVVRSLDTGFKPHETVWMQVFPAEVSHLYRFIDPRAPDLKKCGYVFCRLDAFEGGEVSLDEVVASSFSGIIVMQLVQNFIKAWRLESALIHDGSTVIGCCTKGPPSSLQIASILKTGKSWYELQGANHRLAYEGFQKLAEARFVDDYYENSLTAQCSLRIPNYSFDYDAYRFHALSLHHALFLISKTAYSEAASYLRSLCLLDLLGALEVLTPSYPQLSAMQSVLKKVASGSDSTKKTITLGDALESQENSGFTESTHAELHEFRDYVVGNKDSVFFQYVVDSSLKEAPSVKSFTYVSCILDYFFCITNSFKDFGCLDLDFSLDAVIYCQVSSNISQAIKEEGNARVAQAMESAKKSWADAYILYHMKNEYRYPVSAKILAHSNDTTRRAWITNKDEIGITNLFSALEMAIKLMANTPLDTLQEVCPALINRWRSSCGKEIQSNDTFKDFLDSVEGEREQFLLVQELSSAVRCSLSELAVQQFQEYTKNPNTKDVYPLLMFAKYLCEKSRWTHLEV